MFLKCSVLLLSSFVFCEPIRKHIMAEISLGELIDKITILQIKTARITNAKKQEHIYTELIMLLTIYKASIEETPVLQELTQQLRTTNEALWDIEDAIREKEKENNFDQEFIELARNVYHKNDERFRIKYMINELYGSSIIEEKLYTQYTPKQMQTH